MKAVCTAILAILEWLGFPGSTAPGAPADAVPLASGTETTAQVFALLRTIDPCAMHDVAAAAVITGDHPDQILPGTSLAACQLRLHHRPGVPSWTFTIEVGVVYPAARRQASTLEEVDGRRLYRDEDTGLHSQSCTYTRPMGADYGINLTAVAPPGDTRPCPMAKAYLTNARSLSRLVLRAEKQTEPRLALASVDPCAAATPVLEHLGMPGTAYPQSLYECRIQPQPPDSSPGTPTTVSFGFSVDPSELAGSDADHSPVTVAGHRGMVATAADAQQCVVTVAYDPDLAAVHVDRTRWVQTISVHTTCDHATPLAEAVVHAVTTR